MTTIIIMFPAVVLAATEDMLREIITKANKIMHYMTLNRNVRIRRSRSQHRWA